MIQIFMIFDFQKKKTLYFPPFNLYILNFKLQKVDLLAIHFILLHMKKKKKLHITNFSYFKRCACYLFLLLFLLPLHIGLNFHQNQKQRMIIGIKNFNFMTINIHSLHFHQDIFNYHQLNHLNKIPLDYLLFLYYYLFNLYSLLD